MVFFEGADMAQMADIIAAEKARNGFYYWIGENICMLANKALIYGVRSMDVARRVHTIKLLNFEILKLKNN